MELSRSATNAKDISNDNKSNGQDNTDVIDNKINEGSKETMVSVGTNNMVLELSRSATNAKDVSNNTNEDNNKKSKERDDTNAIENKGNDGAKESMARAIGLIQDAGGKKDITSNKNKQSNDDAKDDVDSGNRDEEVDKTGNGKVGKRHRRKGAREMVTTKEKRIN